MGIETVLVADVSGKHLVDTARGKIDEPLLGIQNFDSFGQCWAHTNHVGGHIENDGGLLAVGSTTIYLGAFLAVAAGQEQGNCGCQLALALLFGDLDVSGVELTVAVALDGSENVPDDLLLPVDQLKRLPCPGAFGVAQAFDKADRIVSSGFVIVGAFRHELGGRVFLQLSDMRSPP